MEELKFRLFKMEKEFQQIVEKLVEQRLEEIKKKMVSKASQTTEKFQSKPGSQRGHNHHPPLKFNASDPYTKKSPGDSNRKRASVSPFSKKSDSCHKIQKSKSLSKLIKPYEQSKVEDTDIINILAPNV